MRDDYAYLVYFIIGTVLFVLIIWILWIILNKISGGNSEQVGDLAVQTINYGKNVTVINL